MRITAEIRQGVKAGGLLSLKDKSRLIISGCIAALVHVAILLSLGILPGGLSRGVSDLGTLYGIDLIDLAALDKMEIADHYSLEGKPGPDTSGHSGSKGVSQKPSGPRTTQPITKSTIPAKPAAASTQVKQAVKPSNSKPQSPSSNRIAVIGSTSTTAPGLSVAQRVAPPQVSNERNPGSSEQKSNLSGAAEPNRSAITSGNGIPGSDGGGRGTGNGLGNGDGNGYGVGVGSGSGTGLGSGSGGPPPPPSFGDGRSAIVKMTTPRFPKDDPDENGSVALIATVGPDGKVTGVKVTSSSGVSSMDRTAMFTVERYWSFVPKEFPYEVDITVVFAHDKLEGSSISGAAVHVNIGKWRKLANGAT